ncbi:hypothetical protein WJX84_000587 [Apatococcus fuscideae]|uniref:Guanylate cyclase domain-containing protein n=1 Tax=Apatococcus fuscideae TaxID=2026836 RepID=A0AAW1STP3_9CHLO
MLLYMLLHRRPPAEVSIERIEAMKMAPSTSFSEACPAVEGNTRLHRLLERIWYQDPAARPTFEEICMDLAGPLANQGTTCRSSTGPGPSANDILEDVFPADVAAALQKNLPIEPESFSDVTIFFSDIVGFTTIASVMQPQDVADMLDRLYRRMDQLAEEHGIYKVETIVASIVGLSRPRYCLFGHTVNIASRMESTGQANRIQLSASGAAAVRRDPYLCELIKERPGLTEIKGQGAMATYWLHTIREEALQLSRHKEYATRRSQSEKRMRYGMEAGMQAPCMLAADSS